ncbi:hypothetical protein ACGFYA_20190 [Streptomyces sp. NPDC048305]|uniref:hypothetical protein n=1 Tax=Streptomyces sp. NPDC048305 TaxID=3365532 RepID=UPI00371EA0B3
MNLRSLSLALLALLSTAGCVSVQPEMVRPAPVSGPRSGDEPVRASVAPVAPPAVHDSLGRSEERPVRGEKRGREERERADRPARQAGEAVPPARREVEGMPRLRMPPQPEGRRIGAPRAALPRPPHDMGSVCATGRGVASADIVDLCRTTYGR